MSLGTQEERTEGMKRQARDLIDQAYQRGFKAGVESCVDSLTADSEKYIEQGRNEAWEAAKKLVSRENSGLSFSKICEIFNVDCHSSVFRNYTATEAVEKLRAYEEQKTKEEAAIKELEQTHWIPVSERLPDNPENNDYYLVTSQCEHYDGWDDYVTGFAEWTEHGWDELSCYVGQIKVVAWMPLPEPYKEESEGE